MSQHTRERALRALVAALLNSGLTPREIQETARALKTDPTMGEHLVQLVDVIVEQLSSVSEPKRLKPRSVESAPLESTQFIEAADAEGLPKEVLVRRLQSYAQRPDWNPSLKSARRKILEEFVSVAPPSLLRPALAALKAGPVEPDPYVDLTARMGKVRHG